MWQPGRISRLFIIALIVIGVAGATAVPAFAAGTASGDRVCAGNNLVIGSTETVNAILAFGCNVTIQENATVHNDISAFGGNVLNQGNVGGTIVAFGGNIRLAESSTVTGDVRAIGGTVDRQPGSTVHGRIGTNFGGSRPDGNPVTITANGGAFGRPFIGFDILGGLVTAIAFAALGALVVVFAPEPTRRIGNAVQAKPLNTAGVGCLTLILLPILGLLLIVTIAGIPVALVLGILSVFAWIFGWIGVGYLAGEKILAAFRTRDILPVLAVIVGILVLMIVAQIPIIGWLLWFVVGLVGIGAVVLTRFGTRAYPAPSGLFMLPPAPVTTSSTSSSIARTTPTTPPTIIVDVQPATNELPNDEPPVGPMPPAP